MKQLFYSNILILEPTESENHQLLGRPFTKVCRFKNPLKCFL